MWTLLHLTPTFDTELYSINNFEGYEQSIPINEDEESEDASDNEIA